MLIARIQMLLINLYYDILHLCALSSYVSLISLFKSEAFDCENIFLIESKNLDCKFINLSIIKLITLLVKICYFGKFAAQ